MRTHNRIARLPWLALLLVSCACASVPKEAVTLSDTVGKDITAMRTAHTELVRLYFKGIRDNVNQFVDQTYRPFIIETTMAELNLIQEIQNAAAGRSELDPLDVMEIYVEEAMDRIAAFRAEMLAPIDRQEHDLLRKLSRSYDALVNANATVTAHLRSVTKVHEAQQEVLTRLGVRADLREEIASGLGDVSGRVKTLLDKARGAEEMLDQLPGKLGGILGTLDIEMAKEGKHDATK